MQANALTDEVVEALVRSKRAGRLIGLNLNCNWLTDRSMHLLAESALPGQLKWLDLSYCDLSEAGIELARSLPCLTHIGYQFAARSTWDNCSPGYRITIRGDEYHYFEAGRLPGGELAVFYVAASSDRAEPGRIPTFWPDGRLKEILPVEWPTLKAPIPQYRYYNGEEIFRHLFDILGFNPATVRVHETHEPTYFKCLCSTLEEVLENGNHWDSDERDEDFAWVRRWIADQDFSVEHGNDRWHHDTGEFHSS